MQTLRGGNKAGGVYVELRRIINRSVPGVNFGAQYLDSLTSRGKEIQTGVGNGHTRPLK